MSDCIFCKLAQKERPTEVVYEDDVVFAFRDAHPAAKIHYLFIPKLHVASLNDLSDPSIISHIFSAIQKLAKEEGFAESGYRIVTNCGADGGQTIGHLHFHVLAGEPIRFPGFDEEAE